MIKNGFYYPEEAYEKLKHYDYIKQEVLGEANIHICAGNRTAGKTVGYAIKLIQEYEKHGEKALLLARTEKQKLGRYLEKWWFKTFNVDDEDGVIQNFRNSHEIKFTPDYMTVDGEVMCYCEAISQSHLVKDMGSYDHCTRIILDEAVQTGEASLIINGRAAMDRIFEIWQTVARGWKFAVACTVIIFIMNTSERNNWLFNDLGVNNFLRADTKKTLQNGIYVEVINNKAASEAVKLSGMAGIMQRSVSGARYYDSAQNNEFMDNTAFVHSRSLNFRNLKIQFVVRTHCLGVFKEEDGWHVSKIEPDDRSKKICNSYLVHREDTIYEIYSDWQRLLEQEYQKGNVTFQTQESKALFEEYCRG